MTQMMESKIIDQAKCQHPWYNVKYQLKVKLAAYQGNIKFYFFMQHQKFLRAYSCGQKFTSTYQEYECQGHFGHYIISVWNDGTVNKSFISLKIRDGVHRFEFISDFL